MATAGLPQGPVLPQDPEAAPGRTQEAQAAALPCLRVFPNLLSRH